MKENNKILDVNILKDGIKLSSTTIEPGHYSIYRPNVPNNITPSVVDCVTFRNNLLIFLSPFMYEEKIHENMQISNMIQNIESDTIKLVLKCDDRNANYVRAVEELSKWVYINMKLCGYDIGIKDIVQFISTQGIQYR